jgi:hypothetical protein
MSARKALAKGIRPKAGALPELGPASIGTHLAYAFDVLLILEEQAICLGKANITIDSDQGEQFDKSVSPQSVGYSCLGSDAARSFCGTASNRFDAGALLLCDCPWLCSTWVTLL